MTLLSIDFGVLAMFVGAATGSRGSALGITSALAAASYLISSLAPAVHWLRPARYASPFYYAVGDGQLDHGIGVAVGRPACRRSGRVAPRRHPGLQPTRRALKRRGTRS